MMLKRFCAVAVATVLLLAMVACRQTEEMNRDLDNLVVDLGGVGGERPIPYGSEWRDYYTTLKGNGEDTVTLMVYMCASDLESQAGQATSDLAEILNTYISEQVNVIIETGGATVWQDEILEPTTQRWEVNPPEEGGLVQLEDLGTVNMTDPATLASFIQFCAQSYPADRYGLILWDHGGGTIGGYAYDENFPDSPSMSLDKIDRALAAGGVKFDFVGFDCCYMATAETALALAPHADYMIASQMAEPGGGWYYTGWIAELSANTSLPTPQLAELLGSEYISTAQEHAPEGSYTVSLTDLTYTGPLFAALDAYLAEVDSAMVDGEAFLEVSQARYGSRMQSSDIDQVDLRFLMESYPAASSETLAGLLQSCVPYSASTAGNYHGLSIYFPYNSLDHLGGGLSLLEYLGAGESHRSFFSNFGSLMLGGQAYSGGGDDMFENSGAGEQAEALAQEEWVVDPLISVHQDYYRRYSFNRELPLEFDAGLRNYVLRLDDEQRALLTDVDMQMFVDDGNGYIYLGADNRNINYTAEGDLSMTLDSTWIALNDKLVGFYIVESYYESEDNWYSWGYSPVIRNGRNAHLVIRRDNTNPNGYIQGYRSVTSSPQVEQRGLYPLRSGDTLEFVCDYYDYDENYLRQYTLSKLTWISTSPPTVSNDITVEYFFMGDAGVVDIYSGLAYFVLTDIYNNVYWTQPIYWTDSTREPGFEGSGGMFVSGGVYEMYDVPWPEWVPGLTDVTGRWAVDETDPFAPIAAFYEDGTWFYTADPASFDASVLYGTYSVDEGMATMYCMVDDDGQRGANTKLFGFAEVQDGALFIQMENAESDGIYLWPY